MGKTILPGANGVPPIARIKRTLRPAGADDIDAYRLPDGRRTDLS